MSARYQTNNKLLVVCSAVIYYLFMAIWPNDGQIHGPVGLLWFALFTDFSHQWQVDAVGTSSVLLFLLCTFGGASLVFGWIVQGLCVLMMSRLASHAPPSEHHELVSNETSVSATQSPWLLAGTAVGVLFALIFWPSVRPGPGPELPIMFAVGGALVGLFLDFAMRPTRKSVEQVMAFTLSSPSVSESD
jgi:hypothetical protein